MLDTYRIGTLDHVRLLSDPLKLRILQILAERESTAREIAAALGDKVTRLYRHVDALLDAGLIEVSRETPKRGTIERTFRAVARRFEVDHALFTGDDDARSALGDHLQAVDAELARAMEVAGEDETLFMRLRIKASPRKLGELRGRLLEWAEDLQANDDDDDDDEDEAEEAGALIAFYPIAPGG
jgi:DNA-binding transcriptional ArsR family regulator